MFWQWLHAVVTDSTADVCTSLTGISTEMGYGYAPSASNPLRNPFVFQDCGCEVAMQVQSMVTQRVPVKMQRPITIQV